MEVRRQKHVVLPRLPIVVPDAPQPMRALLSPLRARELDGLIRSHAPLRVDFPRLHHAVLDPPLEPRHQVNPLRNQRIDPREVHVRAVRGDDAALRQCQRARRLDVRRLPVRHPNERRQIPLVVQADVHLHRPLRPPELRPRKRRQTQVNGCRIHREQLGFEPVAMSRRLRLAAPQQSPVQLLVHLPRLLGVHPRERRPRHHADPQVVELARLCGKIRDDVPQAAASCQLGHPHATNWPQRVMLRDIRPDLCLRARLSNSCLGTSLSTVNGHPKWRQSEQTIDPNSSAVNRMVHLRPLVGSILNTLTSLPPGQLREVGRCSPG